MLEGIDVSHYQGDVDWAKVKAAGKTFAFAKATEGTGYTDPKFAANKSGATAAGLIFGAYHFFEPTNDGDEQGKYFNSVANLGSGNIRAVLDLEKAPTSISSDVYLSNVQACLNRIGSASASPAIIYASPAFYNEHLSAGSFSSNPLWLADYNSTPTLPEGVSSYTFWQYSCTGTVDGVDGDVDLDKFNGDADALQKLCVG